MSSTRPTEHLPLFPLNTVLFPGTVLPMRIFEPRYIDMIGRCMKTESCFGIVTIAHGSETGRAAEFQVIGTKATIIDFDQGNDGLLGIQVVGGQRFNVIAHTIQTDNLIVGEIQWLDEIIDKPVPNASRYLSEVLTDIFSQTQQPHSDDNTRLESSLWLAYHLAAILPIDLDAKISLLDRTSALEIIGYVDDCVRSLQSMPKRDNGPKS